MEISDLYEKEIFEPFESLKGLGNKYNLTMNHTIIDRIIEKCQNLIAFEKEIFSQVVKMHI